jgi:heterotetrameric sarcosine oxidase gamma subunit
MAEAGGAPQPRSACGAALAPRRLGPEAGEPGVRLLERAPLAIWQIAAWREAEVTPLRAALAERLDVALPEGPDAAGGGSRVAFRIAPRRWWLIEDGGREAAATALAEALAGRAALTDLSHARSVLRLAGPASREVLAGLCRIDLHPQALPAGRVVQTALGQVAALIHAVDDEPCFDLYLPRSLAGSGLAAVLDVAAGFGVAIGD